MSTTLLKSGTLITASETFRADILIEDEKIRAIGTDLDDPGAQVIEVSGKLIMPGGIDPHTHFDLPMFNTVSSDDHYTGHKAAAFGGTTTTLDFVPEDYPTLTEAVEVWHRKADPKAAIDFGFHMNITRLDDKVIGEIPHLVEMGITTLKVFTAYNGRLRLSAPLYVVHLNTAGGVDQIGYARERGVKVMGETCPQYLFFTEEHLRRPDGAKWICSPPMRTADDNLSLWQGLAGEIIQTVGTDHCPFFYDGDRPIVYEGEEIAIPGKELGKNDFTKIPNGLPGVGDRLPVLWTYGVRSGKLTPNQFVAKTSTNPAKIFGLYPRKGALLPGSDADIVVWDPERRLTYGLAHAHHRTDYNLYENWELVGFPEKVFLRGQLIVDGEKWLGRAGMGQFLHRQTDAPVL
ncbi:MAG: amidohydrolase family protein [Anaerolineales bacterium]